MITVELTEEELRAVLDVVGPSVSRFRKLYRGDTVNGQPVEFPLAQAEYKLDLALLAHEENENAKSL